MRGRSTYFPANYIIHNEKAKEPQQSGMFPRGGYNRVKGAFWLFTWLLYV